MKVEVGFVIGSSLVVWILMREDGIDDRIYFVYL